MSASTLRSGRFLWRLASSSSATLVRPFQGAGTGCRYFCSDSETFSYKSSGKQYQLSFAPGIYKAILIGKVGQTPSVKVLSDGSQVVCLALGTGGLRNNRKANEEETIEAYAQRSFTQWHRVRVFKPALLHVAKQIERGMNIYVEGSIETRLFIDPVTRVVKRIREISVRHNGRLYIIDHKPVPLLAAQQ